MSRIKVHEKFWLFPTTQVSWDEFLRLLNFKESETVLNQVFSLLDKDGSGELTVEEMKEAIEREGELRKLRPYILRALDSHSKDAGKKLNYQQFVILWHKQKQQIRK